MTDKNEVDLELKDLVNSFSFENTKPFLMEILNEDSIKEYPITQREKVKELISKINENVEYLDNNVNRYFFNKLVKNNYDIESLEKISNFTSLLKEDEYFEIDNEFSGIFDDEINENIYNTEELIDYINDDVEENGTNSKYYNLLDDLKNLNPYAEYVKVNERLNGFESEYENWEEVLQETFKNKPKRILNKFFDYHTSILKNDKENKLEQ